MSPSISQDKFYNEDAIKNLHFQRIKDAAKDSDDAITGAGALAVGIAATILGGAIAAAAATPVFGLTLATLITALSLGLGTPVGWVALIILAAIIVTLIIVIVGAIISLAIAQDNLQKAITNEENIRNQIITQCSIVAGGLNCLNFLPSLVFLKKCAHTHKATHRRCCVFVRLVFAAKQSPTTSR